MYTTFLLWKCVCTLYTPLYILNLCVYATWYIVNLCIPLFLHSCYLPAILWSFIWESCHQGQHLCHTCIIMPTISPFGLDGNNHTKSLSPFDIKGKGRTKIFSPLIYILLSILPLSTCWNIWLSSPLCTCQDVPIHPCSPWAHAKSAKIFFKRISWLYNSTKWVWPSYDSYIHQSPNQVGIHHFLPSTQPSGDIPNVYTWLQIDIITSSFPCKLGLQIRSFHDLYIKWYTWPFITMTINLNKTMIVISNYHTPYMICSVSICQQHL